MSIENCEIKKIAFGILSPKEIERYSVCEVTSSKLIGEGSVYDSRMGFAFPSDKSERCPSCNLTFEMCPGHFGHIVLNELVMHPMYLKNIANYLKCFCPVCRTFYLTKENLEIKDLLRYTGDYRFNQILEVIEKEIKICRVENCRATKRKIKLSVADSLIYTIYTDGGRRKRIVFTDKSVKDIFDTISDDTVRLLGFDPELQHPRNLVLKNLPVMPPKSRPPVGDINENKVSDDDLTTQYIEIVKANNHLLAEDSGDREKFIAALKFRIKTLMNNSHGKAKYANGRALTGIKERISSKTGIIRNNLQGRLLPLTGECPMRCVSTHRGKHCKVHPERVYNHLVIFLTE